MQASMQASSRREHEAPAPSRHRHSTFHGAPSTGLRLLRGFSQGKDGQRRGGGDAGYPAEEGWRGTTMLGAGKAGNRSAPWAAQLKWERR